MLEPLVSVAVVEESNNGGLERGTQIAQLVLTMKFKLYVHRYLTPTYLEL